ncbi:GNAT family N-acetyltransferase [Streptomyces spectabilis]|uniref:GNAT family N-acetyltransferase n=1 Tax=Streptomyces spectabilis TaxID=68270 RepID=A0A5P2XLS6_STRST|nr:GNAT family N-acetyltransferase [Streptomyces spectabilis]MBB5102300.1 ribosomal protein S18 acetylase RimI-like enzyme [Streptomyces spectabilis]MCI3907348.1 GNAT family N-acetyltransferase [Streptomyces spectabilis]QEV64075.1 GNAT family N-acetyltransferase [Streptomyces spectabilis]GGV29979.1 molybdopterin-guanine dinucleotide biosynthesis protein MobC [Streptomyces spectabilis]
MSTTEHGRTAAADGAPDVRRGVPEGAEDQVAALYWEAFGRKLGPGLGPADAGQAFLARHLHHDRGVVATRGERVVGVAGFQLDGRALTGGGIRDVLSAYGPLRGLPRLAVLALFERTAAAGELVMDGIAVAADQRGHGIGSLLLREVAAVAAEAGCRRVRLEVIDVNPRARALYERHGFTATRTRRTPYLRSLMGFDAVTPMHRAVTPAPTPTARETR